MGRIDVNFRGKPLIEPEESDAERPTFDADMSALEVMELIVDTLVADGASDVKARDHIIIRTWERGAGLTQACGSAACATLVSAVRKNLTDRTATVTVPGGDLRIGWADNDHVMMTGPAEWEFAGHFDPKTGEWRRDGIAANDNGPHDEAVN